MRDNANSYDTNTLENRCVKDPAPGCWLWSLSKNHLGYGRIMIMGTAISAHRFSWIVHNGAIPDGICVLHKCDVRHCVNPDHLFLGTQQDNIADMNKKGRHADLKGADNGRAKLTEDDVINIRYSCDSQKDLAEEYKVSIVLISRILSRKSWRHVC